MDTSAPMAVGVIVAADRRSNNNSLSQLLAARPPIIDINIVTVFCSLCV
jgi:hypothetical protein